MKKTNPADPFWTMIREGVDPEHVKAMAACFEAVYPAPDTMEFEAAKKAVQKATGVNVNELIAKWWPAFDPSTGNQPTSEQWIDAHWKAGGWLSQYELNNGAVPSTSRKLKG